MNSDMVKPEKFGILQLVYHFTVPLNGVHYYEYPILEIAAVRRFTVRWFGQEQSPSLNTFAWMARTVLSTAMTLIHRL